MDLYKKIYILFIFGLASLYFVGLDANFDNYDESSIYFYSSMMIGHGKMPYSDFTYTQPSCFGSWSYYTARLFTVGCLLVSCIVLFSVGKKFGVGYFAVIFMLSSSLIMEYGKLGTGDIPLMMGSLITLDMLLMGVSWAVLGVLFLNMFILKIQSFILINCITSYNMIFNNRNYILSLMFCIGGFLLYSAVYPGLFGSVITNNITSIGVCERAYNIATTVVGFIYKNSLLSVFAAIGIVDSFRHKKGNFNYLYLYLVSGWLMLLVYGGINFRHFIYLVPVLGVFAGIGLKNLKNSYLYLGVIILLCINVIPQFREGILVDDSVRDIAKLIGEKTIEGDMIYSDEPVYAVLSDREMPPTANMWNGLGRNRKLSSDDIIGDLNNYKPKLFIYTDNIYDNRYTRPRIETTFGVEDRIKIEVYLLNNYHVIDVKNRNYQEVIILERN